MAMSTSNCQQAARVTNTLEHRYKATRKCILVVEDHRLSLVVMHQLLAARGYDVLQSLPREPTLPTLRWGLGSTSCFRARGRLQHGWVNAQRKGSARLLASSLRAMSPLPLHLVVQPQDLLRLARAMANTRSASTSNCSARASRSAGVTGARR